MTPAAAVIVAAGRGRRMGRGGNKVFLPLAGRPLLWWTLRAFEACPAIAGVVIVVGEGEEEDAGKIAARFAKIRAICPGGETRGQSVTAGLARLPERAEAGGPLPIVAVHDGARPLVTPALIAACVETAAARGAALPALPITDTLKRVRPDGTVQATVERAGLYGAQTPQTFRRDLLLEAYARARAEGYEGTDDASLVERLGHPVPIVPGEPENLKVTVADDLPRAAAVLDRRFPIAETRVGLGYDVHRLVEGRPLVLGGVPIRHSHGLEGHSDADVLLHALCDALLGACALGDIGLHFPNTDPRYRGIDSRELLRAVVRLLADAGWEPRQVDVTLLAEAPRIRPHVPAMQSAIAADLGLSPDRVSVKATTSERLGFVGRQDGMAAWAVATVARRDLP